MLTTLLRPTSGKAYVNGYDVVKEEDKAKTTVGLVAGEERSFYWRLTGRQNLHFFATLYGLSPLDSKKRVDAILEQLELEDAANNMFYSYSSGMKQKLALARSLISNPEVLFLDEPTKSVDVMTGRDLRSFIKKNLVEKEGRTIFLTTHRLEEAEALCNRLAIINHGRIVFCGTIEELRQKIHLKYKFIISIKVLYKNRLQQICKHPSLDGLAIEESAGSQTKINFMAADGQNPLSYVVENILKNGATLMSVNKIEPKLEDLFTDFLNTKMQTLSPGERERVRG